MYQHTIHLHLIITLPPVIIPFKRNLHYEIHSLLLLSSNRILDLEDQAQPCPNFIIIFVLLAYFLVCKIFVLFLVTLLTWNWKSASREKPAYIFPLWTTQIQNTPTLPLFRSVLVAKSPWPWRLGFSSSFYSFSHLLISVTRFTKIKLASWIGEFNYSYLFTRSRFPRTTNVLFFLMFFVFFHE